MSAVALPTAETDPEEWTLDRVTSQVRDVLCTSLGVRSVGSRQRYMALAPIPHLGQANVVDDLNRHFELTLAVEVIYANGTLTKLANEVHRVLQLQLVDFAPPPLTSPFPRRSPAYFPLSHAQEECWFRYQQHGDGSASRHHVVTALHPHPSRKEARQSAVRLQSRVQEQTLLRSVFFGVGAEDRPVQQPVSATGVYFCPDVRLVRADCPLKKADVPMAKAAVWLRCQQEARNGALVELQLAVQSILADQASVEHLMADIGRQIPSRSVKNVRLSEADEMNIQLEHDRSPKDCSAPQNVNNNDTRQQLEAETVKPLKDCSATEGATNNSIKQQLRDAPAEPADPLQYADFARWQREQFTLEHCGWRLKQWGRLLKEVEEIPLPTDRPRPKKTERPVTSRRTVDDDLWESVNRLCADEVVCHPQHVYLAFLYEFLHRTAATESTSITIATYTDTNQRYVPTGGTNIPTGATNVPTGGTKSSLNGNFENMLLLPLERQQRSVLQTIAYIKQQWDMALEIEVPAQLLSEYLLKTKVENRSERRFRKVFFRYIECGEQAQTCRVTSPVPDHAEFALVVKEENDGVSLTFTASTLCQQSLDELTDQFVCLLSNSLSTLQSCPEAKWLPDGQVPIGGQIDQQITLRGCRIDLEEIESLLCEVECVSVGHIVVLCDDAGKAQSLVAVYVPVDAAADEAQNNSQIRLHLAQSLTPFMMPANYVSLEKIPLKASSDEIDKIPLKTIVLERIQSVHTKQAKYTTQLEALVGQVWGEVLGIWERAIPPDDNFFSAGGNSLLVLEVRQKLSARLKTDVKVADLFCHQTIRQFADFVASELIEDKQVCTAVAMHNGPKDGSVGTLVCVHPLLAGLNVYNNIFNLDTSAGYGSWPGAIYGVEHPNTFDERMLQCPFDAEKLVRMYIDDMRKVLPEKPMAFMGSSIGGTILHLINEALPPNERLPAILIDSDAFTDKGSKRFPGISDLTAVITEYMQAVEEPIMRRMITSGYELWNIFNIYHEKAYECIDYPVFLFIAGDYDKKDYPPGHDHLAFAADLCSKWSQISCRRVTYDFLPGVHATLWNRNHVQKTSAKSTAILAELSSLKSLP